MTTDDDFHDPTDARLDAELRRAFAPPAAGELASVARAVTRPRVAPWLAPVLMAAAALFVALGVFLLARAERVTGPEGHDAEQLGAMWAAAYDRAVAEGTGAPDSCCDPKLDFCACCEELFSVRLELAEGTAELRLRGGYRGLPTGGCAAALLDTPNGPVGVFAVPRAHDPGPCLPQGSTLQLARRELGPIVLYAVAGRQQPEPQKVLEPFVARP